jgi:hypothetical protein
VGCHDGLPVGRVLSLVVGWIDGEEEGGLDGCVLGPLVG